MEKSSIDVWANSWKDQSFLPTKIEEGASPIFLWEIFPTINPVYFCVGLGKASPEYLSQWHTVQPVLAGQSLAGLLLSCSYRQPWARLNSSGVDLCHVHVFFCLGNHDLSRSKFVLNLHLKEGVGGGVRSNVGQTFEIAECLNVSVCNETLTRLCLEWFSVSVKRVHIVQVLRLY